MTVVYGQWSMVYDLAYYLLIYLAIKKFGEKHVIEEQDR
jgi:hypothetical protein